MKFFLTVSLIVAFMAMVCADELNDEKGAFTQCHKDLYSCYKQETNTAKECLVKYKDCMAALIPTMPYFMTLCKKDLTFCTSHAQGIKAKADCYIEYGKCLKNGGPTPVTYSPSHHAMDDSSTGQFTDCHKELYNCYKAENSSAKECLIKYKDCMAALVPTMPYYVTLCNKDLSWCVSHANGIKAQAVCFYDYGKCLKDGGPTPVTYAPEKRMPPTLAPTHGPLAQCQIDLYNCNNNPDKTVMECLVDYKDCMAQLIPPYVATCKKEADKCYENATGLKDKAKCAIDFSVCLSNGGPTQAA
ncbi:uncharacterized protein LOC113683212 [Pocillopora damicornis]|nr:uncharacterized protein LOC113683212 [Pocillopora damicornis]